MKITVLNQDGSVDAYLPCLYLHVSLGHNPIASSFKILCSRRFKGDAPMGGNFLLTGTHAVTQLLFESDLTSLSSPFLNPSDIKRSLEDV